MTKIFTTLSVVMSVFANTAASQDRDGELDESFGVNGVTGASFLDNDFGYDVATTPEGTIVVVGSSENIGDSSGRDARAVIYDSQGNQIDTNTFPLSVFGCPNVAEVFYTALLEPAGTILAGGYGQFDCGGSQRDFWIVRMDANGNEMIRFDRPVFHGVQENIRAMALQADGQIVAAGFSDTNPSDSGTRGVAVARYNLDGTLDKSFGIDGEVLVDVAGDFDWIYGVAVDPSGRILVNGFTRINDQFDYLLVRLDTTGGRDDTFGNEGVVTTDINGFDDFTNDLAVQKNGKPIVVGNQTLGDAKTGVFTVARYNEDGTPDDTFGANGLATVDFGSAASAAASVELQQDCKIVVSGFAQFDEDGESTDMIAVARLNNDGSLDTGFNGTGTQLIDVAPGQDDYTAGLTSLPNGNLVISGHSADRSKANVTWNMALASIINDNVLFSSPFDYCP